MVCAAPAQHELSRPSDHRHERCAGVAAPTTTAQTVWVVNFYSTANTSQYTARNPATTVTMSHHAETSLTENAIVMIKATLETSE